MKFRHLVPETVNKIIGQRQKKMPHLQKISTDFVLPSVAMKEMYDFYRQILDKENIEYVIFGHIGENHLHVNILPQNDSELEKATRIYRQLAKKAAKLKGSLSGEHGIGKIKKFLLPMMFTEKQINEMKTLKKSLAAMHQIKIAMDPKSILGQGTLF